jgi:hypothetical protein
MKLVTFLAMVGVGTLAVSACSSSSDGGTGGTSGSGGASGSGATGGSGAVTGTGGSGATGTGGSGAVGTGGSGATGTGGAGGGSADCNPQLQGQTCTVLQTTDPNQNACLQGDCCDEATACLANAECASLIYCGSVCLQGGGTPESCSQTCASCVTSQAPVDLYNGISTCVTSCVSGGTGGAGGAGGSAGAAGSPGDGGA